MVFGSFWFEAGFSEYYQTRLCASGSSVLCLCIAVLRHRPATSLALWQCAENSGIGSLSRPALCLHHRIFAIVFILVLFFLSISTVALAFLDGNFTELPSMLWEEKFFAQARAMIDKGFGIVRVDDVYISDRSLIKITPTPDETITQANIYTLKTVSSSVTSYTDKAAESGRSYYYTVRAVADGYRNAYQNYPIYYLAAPKITKFDSQVGKGITIKWADVLGAEKYYVYRKTSNYGHFGRPDPDFYWERTDKAEALKKHYEWQGKIEVVSRKKIETKEDLSLLYTPGVAEPCLEIAKDKNLSYELTRKHNLVAVISDGTAVLGLGDIGPRSLLFLVLSGLATGASWICYFKALSVGDINKVVPIDKSSTVLTVLIAIICFGEISNLAVKLIATAILAVGIFLMVEKKKSEEKASGKAWMLYAVLSAVFAALTSILAKCGIKKTDSDLATALRTVVVLLFSWIMVFVVGSAGTIFEISPKTFLFLALSGIATGASWI